MITHSRTNCWFVQGVGEHITDQQGLNATRAQLLKERVISFAGGIRMQAK
ncbi:MAG: hypothetical protein M3Z24_05840 [Chloroflexota bacterium]|nr:hypothetical protein [Chloroflexota bacterium]